MLRLDPSYGSDGKREWLQWVWRRIGVPLQSTRVSMAALKITLLIEAIGLILLKIKHKV